MEISIAGWISLSVCLSVSYLQSVRVTILRHKKVLKINTASFLLMYGLSKKAYLA